MTMNPGTFLFLSIVTWGPAFVSTQTTETAVLHIADDAFGTIHHDDATFYGTADISDSVTEYYVDCTADMNGCKLFDSDSKTSFYFSEVDGTTTYTIDAGPHR